MPTTTIGIALASRNEADLLGPCLDAVCGPAHRGGDRADDVVVFDLASADPTAEVAASRGARVITHDAVPFVELIRGAQLAVLDTDWVLFLDPDEVVPAGWLAAAHRLVDDAPDDVAAYWIGYDDVAFGRRLEHTRTGAAKVTLVRREFVSPPAEPRPHLPLDVRGRVGPRPASLPPIEHHSYRSVAESIGKLSRYAVAGGVGAPLPGSPVGPLTGITLLWRAIVVDRAWRDGAPGIAVATLSAVGDLLGGLQRWDAEGRADGPPGRRTVAALWAGRLVSRVRSRARQLVRRSSRPG